MTRRLKENEQAREERWATVSHELRTPLATLKANTRGILDGVVPPQETERYLRSSLGEIDRLTLLVDDLILSAGDERGAPPSLAEADVGALVEQVAASMRILAEERGASFVLDVVRPLTARVDALQLRQVFLNLLDNAVRHSPAGGRVFVTAAPREGRVVVTVRDEGPGLGDGDPERWFGKRRKEPGSPGLGLGLPIARRIVEAHGGTIAGRNAEGGGAEFEVLL
jgi:signal transduction histidine kinase